MHKTFIIIILFYYIRISQAHTHTHTHTHTDTQSKANKVGPISNHWPICWSGIMDRKPPCNQMNSNEHIRRVDLSKTYFFDIHYSDTTTEQVGPKGIFLQDNWSGIGDRTHKPSSYTAKHTLARSHYSPPLIQLFQHFMILPSSLSV